MLLRYNFRVYPTPGQQARLARAFGCARMVFNDGLRVRQDAYEQGLPYMSDGELSKQVITEAEATPQRAWLGEVSVVLLQQSLADLNSAYRNFFASLSGKRKGRRVAAPRFRSRKDNRQAIRFTKNSRFKILNNGRLRLPKIGDMKVAWSRALPSDPSSVAIIKDAAGRYFASFVAQTAEDETLPPVEPEIGIDLGLTHFAVLSDGTKTTAPKFLRRAEHPSVELPLRSGPRSGRQRRCQCVGRWAGGQLKRSWSAGETGTCPGTARRSGNRPSATCLTRGVRESRPVGAERMPNDVGLHHHHYPASPHHITCPGSRTGALGTRVRLGTGWNQPDAGPVPDVVGGA